VRSLEDSTLLVLVIVVSLAFAWILWPFFGAVLWAAVLVFAPPLELGGQRARSTLHGIAGRGHPGKS
jgi:hypothetical protein